jgi:hypothetical protein
MVTGCDELHFRSGKGIPFRKLYLKLINKSFISLKTKK